MVQQFFQSQLTSQPSQRRQNLSLNVAQRFGKNNPTRRNIIQWEKILIKSKIILKRKKKEDFDS